MPAMMEPHDIDALRRAVAWARIYQKTESGIQVMPQPMPDKGSPQWIKEAIRLAAIAQAQTLNSPPWKCEPAHVHDGGTVDPNCYGRRPDEVALRRKMLALGISIYEPDPSAAIARAEQRRAVG
jgi:hypothetical protein